MATLKFYDVNEDGQFSINDVQLLLEQHPDLPQEKHQEFQTIAMGLIGQTGMITPGSEVPGAQSIVYGEQGSTSETEITAGQLGEGATATVMDQGIGGDTGFGFDTSSAGFNPETRTDVADYLTRLGFSDDLIRKTQSNINLYDPTKEQQLQTQYGFDVGALGQEQRGTILEGLTASDEQAFKGQGLVSGRRRAGYRQGISESQREFETGLAQKQFGLAKDTLAAQKEYSIASEMKKLYDLGQISESEYNNALQVIRMDEEKGLQGDVPMGYANQQDYLDSKWARSKISDNMDLRMRTDASSDGKWLVHTTPTPGGVVGVTGYMGEDSAFIPLWKGFEGEEVNFTAQTVGEVRNNVGYNTKNWNIKAKWIGSTGDGHWQVTKTQSGS
jgi:hypothetical protein